MLFRSCWCFQGKRRKVEISLQIMYPVLRKRRLMQAAASLLFICESSLCFELTVSAVVALSKVLAFCRL